MYDSEQFMVDWTTDKQTSLDVPLTVIGQGTNLFTDVYKNTYIQNTIIKAMKFK